MDAHHFDALSRALSTGGSRRRILGMLAAAPVAGGLATVIAPRDSGAKKKRRRNKRKKPKPACSPDSAAQTCAGKCGSVTNNCGQRVDCGSCVCSPSCPVCQVCDGSRGLCVPNAAVRGLWCGEHGEPGQVCQINGACRCDATSCPAGKLCLGQQCVDPQGTCPTSADTCDVTVTCNGNEQCYCRISTEGDTRCGGGALAGGGIETCGECTSTAECATLYPAVPGAFCLRGGTGCCDGTAPAGACVAPCST